MLPHEEITKEGFYQILDRYASLIESIDKSKPAKKGQRTLQELDRFRFVDAPDQFAGQNPKREMKQQDVEILVEWKLRHGKYRPTLKSLISSNPPSHTSQTISSAMQLYRTLPPSPLPALKLLTQLKGVGPATASLLLAVHDPSAVIFFSDEAFHWLCGGKPPQRYNMSEYEKLCGEAGRFIDRLGVSALEVEKVAYVLVKQQQGKKGEERVPSMKVDGRRTSATSGPASTTKRKLDSEGGEDTAVKKESKKRKEEKEEKADREREKGPPVRRSQRLRK